MRIAHVIALLVFCVASTSALSSTITSSWDGGYCGEIALTNPGPGTASGFTASLTLASGTINSYWSANWAMVDATHWTITNPSWTTSFVASSTYVAGYCATYTGSLVAPTFTVTFTGSGSTNAPATTAAPGTTKAPITSPPVAGTCGNGNLGNKICADPTLCCSMYGWCDNTVAHCTPPTCVGGPCIGSTTTPPASTAAPGTTKAPTTAAPGTTKAPTTSPPVAGTCGNGNLGNKICADPTLCCSMYGWCDNTVAHCTPPTCVGGPCIGSTTSGPTSAPTDGPSPPSGVCPAGHNCATDPQNCGQCEIATKSACLNPNHVALTFDDGPVPALTNQALAILAANKIKATFFVLGNQAELPGYGAVVKSAYNAGHQIASHGYDHLGPDNGGGLYLDDRSDAALNLEISKNQDILKSILGVKPQYFRAPYLACTTARCLSIVQSYGLQHASRNLDTNDWQLSPTEPNPGPALIDLIHSFLLVAPVPANEGQVVLMHDIHQTTIDGLQAVIDYFRNRGKTFVRLDECFGYQPQAYQM